MTSPEFSMTPPISTNTVGQMDLRLRILNGSPEMVT